MDECLINRHNKLHEFGFRCLSTLWYRLSSEKQVKNEYYYCFRIHCLYYLKQNLKNRFTLQKKKNLLKAKSTSHVWVQGTYVLLLLSGL